MKRKSGEKETEEYSNRQSEKERRERERERGISIQCMSLMYRGQHFLKKYNRGGLFFPVN